MTPLQTPDGYDTCHCLLHFYSFCTLKHFDVIVVAVVVVDCSSVVIVNRGWIPRELRSEYNRVAEKPRHVEMEGLVKEGMHK
jgi:hypothetical protein